MRFILMTFLALASVSQAALSAQSQSAAQNKTEAAEADSLPVQRAAEAFIVAFNNLDWEKFRRSFSDDATVFFPFSQVPRRANGRAEVEAVFKFFFDEVRKQKPNPPYQNIEPKDMKIQVLGDVAVVTFHLGEGDPVGRRTVVFQKNKGAWLIVHLHASTVVKTK